MIIRCTTPSGFVMEFSDVLPGMGPISALLTDPSTQAVLLQREIGLYRYEEVKP